MEGSRPISKGALGTIEFRARRCIGTYFSRFLKMATKIRRDLASVATAHLHFSRWERVTHRAHTYALISFPDNHPFRQAVDDVCRGLEVVRDEVELCLFKIVREHGGFRGLVNGWFFEGEETLFKKDPARYHDCPSWQIGRGIKRSKVLSLAGVGSIHDIETTGRSFLIAANRLADVASPEAKRRLESVEKAFAHDCQKVLKRLKKVKVDPSHKLGVLLCLQRLGLPRENASLVLDFLV